MTNIQEFDLDIESTKIVRGQGIVRIIEEVDQGVGIFWVLLKRFHFIFSFL